MYGELVPVGGGDPIPMMKKRLRIGRREGCDIVLNYGMFRRIIACWKLRKDIGLSVIYGREMA